MAFDALDIAQQAAALVAAGFDGVGGPYRDLRDQATRAAVSAALNLAESIGYDGGNKRRHQKVAYGSAREAKAAVVLALTLGLGSAAKLRDAHDALDRVAAMSWRLMRR
jgi:four helix bundle protein